MAHIIRGEFLFRRVSFLRCDPSHCTCISKNVNSVISTIKLNISGVRNNTWCVYRSLWIQCGCCQNYSCASIRLRQDRYVRKYLPHCSIQNWTVGGAWNHDCDLLISCWSIISCRFSAIRYLFSFSRCGNSFHGGNCQGDARCWKSGANSTFLSRSLPVHH